MNYEQELAKLTPERKIELWSKWEKSNLSKESKIRSVYYDALSKGYFPFEFDNWDKEIKLNIGDTLNIGLYRYKVLDIEKSRVSCERIGIVN